MLPTIMLNVNRLDIPTKSQRMVEWIEKQDPKLCHLQEMHFIYRGRLKVNKWKKVYHANRKKKAGVAILTSNKVDFKTEYYQK